MIKGQAQNGSMINSWLRNLILVFAVCLNSCHLRNSGWGIDENLFNAKERNFKELQNMGYRLGENIDFIAFYKYFGDTLNHEDTLVYYQFTEDIEKNPKSIAIYRHASLYLEQKDVDDIENILLGSNVHMSTDIDTVGTAYFFQVYNSDNEQTFNCSLKSTEQSELFELGIGYSYP